MSPLEKLGLILFKLALSDVWTRVNQPLPAFQIMFGKTTIKIVIKKIINFDLFTYKTLLKRLSKNRRTMREIKKYIAAYFAKNDNPNIIPKRKKFFKDGSCLISIKILIESIQKSNKITSVDIKKDETLTAGITKKLKAQINEIDFCKSSFLQKP